MQFLRFAVLICLVQTFDYSFACNGFDVELISIENGPNNPTFVVQPDPKISLNENCQLYLDGCLDILKPVSNAVLSFKARKNGILTVFDANNFDLCQLLITSNYPKKCPLVQSEYCEAFTNPIDVLKYNYLLAKFLGKVTVEAKIVTNENEVNLFILELKIVLKV